MNRQQKYPDTSTFHFYNANPKNKYTSDCVIRAISTALGQSWEQTVRELTEVGIKYGYVFTDTKCYEHYLKQKGWVKHKQPRKSDNTKYTGFEFCTELETDNPWEYNFDIMSVRKKGNIIAHIGGHHIVAIVNHKVYDTWNSTDGCIGNYWTL